MKHEPATAPPEASVANGLAPSRVMSPLPASDAPSLHLWGRLTAWYARVPDLPLS